MHIYLKIVGETHEPLKREFHGNFAIELMIFTVIEIYFGKDCKIKVERILTGRF